MDDFENTGFTSGFSAANIYGNAFGVEKLSENLYRFHCNDHRMDDDFDDLIFDITTECFPETLERFGIKTNM